MEESSQAPFSNPPSLHPGGGFLCVFRADIIIVIAITSDGAIMANEYGQMQRSGEARHLLDQRLVREEMGDEAYDKMVSNNDDRAFKIFGLVFIVVLGVIFFAINALGY